MRLPVVLVGLALLLSGCSGSKGSAGEGDGAPEALGTGGEGLAAPVWSPGLWWNYTSEQLGGAFTLAVTGEEGSDWIVETDHQGVAFVDERFDISYMGPQSKDGLKGSQPGGARVDFFNFPLHDLKTWTTTWDAQPIVIEAHDLGEGRFHLVATNMTGGNYASYYYSNATGWFDAIAFYAPDGTVGFEMELASNGNNFAGAVDRWTLDEVMSESGDLAGYSGPGAMATNFDVPLTATDVWAQLTVTCTGGSVVIGVAPFPIVGTIAGTEPRGAGAGAPPCQDQAVQGTAGAPKSDVPGATSESWAWSISASPDTVGHVDFTIFVRTLETASV